MKDTKRSTTFLITACFLALAGFGAAQSAPSNPSVLDELMPRPVKVETAAAGETPVVPAAALANVTVIRGPVPGALRGEGLGPRGGEYGAAEAPTGPASTQEGW